MDKFPISPTQTIGIQKAYGITIRKVFRDGFNEILYLINKEEKTVKESLVLKEALDIGVMKQINKILEMIKFRLSPITQVFISLSWNRANKTTAQATGLGTYIPYDKRILKAVQQESYGFLEKYVHNRQDELRKVLSEGLSQGDTIRTIAGKVKKSFKMTSWKSELIARTEVVKTHARSTLTAIRLGGVTHEYKWITCRDDKVCPTKKQKHRQPSPGKLFCRPLHGRIFNIDDRTAPMPAISTHPNCRCSVVPFVRI